MIRKDKSLKYKKTLNGTQKYLSFLTDEFTVLSEESGSSGVPRLENTEAREEKKSLKRKILLLEKEVKSKSFKQIESEAHLEVATDRNEQMKNKICELKEELSTKEKEQQSILSSTIKEKETAKRETEKQFRKNEYAKEKMKEMKETIKDLKVENVRLAKSNRKLEESLKELEDEAYVNIEDLKREKRKLQRKLRSATKKDDVLEEKEEEHFMKLQLEVKELNRENRELSELIELLQKDEIVTFENGKYTNEIREVIMELLRHNVSMGRINGVITTVLKLASKSAHRLPCAGVKSRILQESLTLAQKQVAEAMLEGGIEERSGNVLHGDGTSKYHRHYQNFQVTTKAGRSYSFGQ